LFAFLFAAIFVVVMLEPLQVQRSAFQHGLRKANIIQDYKELIKSERWLKYWFIIMLVQRLGGISMPFIPLWIVQVKGADPFLLGALGTTSALTSLILQIPMGKLADTIGRKKVFLILRPFTYIGTLLLVWAPDPLTLIFAGVLGVMGLMAPGGGGGIGGISFIPFITMYWESFPAEKRGRLQGITGIVDVASSVASLLGGFLWQS
ncbi:MAG: MFS transporter, partial [Candidatus Bathyarchaeia archaeon]